MAKKDIVYINLSNEEINGAFITKYMPLEFALKTLKEKSLWVSNPSEWTDPFEKRFLENKWETPNKYNTHHHPWKNRVYCCCFTNQAISEAHWLIYARGQIGISFRFNFSALLKELGRHTDKYDIYIGKVKYLPTEKTITSLAEIDFTKSKYGDEKFLAELFLLKRNAFEYENEIRIIFVEKENSKIKPESTNKENKPGISIKLSKLQDIIKRITIEPSVGERTEYMLKTWLEKSLESYPQEVKTSELVRRSTIYRTSKANKPIKIYGNSELSESNKTKQS